MAPGGGFNERGRHDVPLWSGLDVTILFFWRAVDRKDDIINSGMFGLVRFWLNVHTLNKLSELYRTDGPFFLTLDQYFLPVTAQNIISTQVKMFRRRSLIKWKTDSLLSRLHTHTLSWGVVIYLLFPVSSPQAEPSSLCDHWRGGRPLTLGFPLSFSRVSMLLLSEYRWPK